MLSYNLVDSNFYLFRLTKLQTKESRDFRGTLKSTGQNKYALKEEDEVSATVRSSVYPNMAYFVPNPTLH